MAMGDDTPMVYVNKRFGILGITSNFYSIEIGDGDEYFFFPFHWELLGPL
jgi:hypothetical protein